MSNDNTDREALAKVIHDAFGNWDYAQTLAEGQGKDWTASQRKSLRRAAAVVAVLPSLGWVKADDGNMLERWADYFEHVGSHVGDPQHLDGPAIARMLRCPPPFGAAAPDTTKEPTP